MIALQLLRESYTVFLLATEMEAKPLQLSKASLPILVTLPGMVRDVRPVQPEKDFSPILVTLFGMETEFRPVQSAKAESSMLMTE